MDQFSTERLVAVVDDLRSRPVGADFLTLFFGTERTEDADLIHFDTTVKPRRMSPFVSPLAQSKLVESQGFKARSFRPAYIKDKRVFDANRPMSRVPGESLLGNLSPAQRLQVLISLDLDDQLMMKRRRLLVMASEILRTGAVTIVGDGFPSVSVSFGRNALNTKTLAGASRWGQAGINPFDNLEDWGLEMVQRCGAAPVDVIFDVLAWRFLKAHADFTKNVDLIRISGISDIDIGPRVNAGLNLRGTMGQYRLWTYQDWYVDSAGVEQKVLPDNTVILGSAAMEGETVYGAIRDVEVLRAVSEWPDSWVEKDPSVRMLRLQSAPLLVPYRPDAAMCVTVN